MEKGVQYTGLVAALASPPALQYLPLPFLPSFQAKPITSFHQSPGCSPCSYLMLGS